MQKCIGLILILGLLMVPVNAGAQGSVKLESINIELWSEFDQPSMLVINEFIVPKTTPLPAKVTMRFPKDGNLIAVAYESNGNLFNTQFESTAEQGNWQTVTLNVESHVPYRIEYYQPLMREENKRLFTYRWFGDYYVKNFSVSLIVPADSTDLTTIPILSTIEIAANGLTLIGTTTQNDLKMGHSYQFDVEYERTSDALSDPDQANQVQPSEPIGPDTPGRVSVDKLPWFIGGVGLALIAIALFIYWRSSESNTQTSAQSGRSRASRQKTGEENDGQIYCQECGTRSNSGDRFCRTCGTRLRVE